MNFNKEVFKILTEWTDRTDMLLRKIRKSMNIGKSGDLENSQKKAVHQLSEAKLESVLEFLLRGRFIDMGVGRGSSKLESREGNAQLLGVKSRKPKRWYSRAYWGRLYDLQGVLGYQLMESAIQAIINPLKDNPQRGSVSGKI
ncbi:hypothetical protein [Belliella pelovolcani]|uniref:hypothetical protein n=1 Tax=Belliella pelovolcani TaxID=529505 RepID=UPI00391A9CEF